MRIFILEDDHERIELFRELVIGHELTIAEDAATAIAILGSDSGFDLFMLDHDLGNRQMVSNDDKNTGSEVVRWIVQSSMKCPTTIIHSYNPDGAESMFNALKKHGVDCHMIKFYDVAMRLRKGTLFA